MIKQIFRAIFLLIPFFASAQQNYQPGYIIKTNGDTLKGYIDLREWETSPDQITFKAGENEQKQSFSPLEISAFSINQTIRYRSFHGQLSADKNQFPNLPQRLDTSTVARKVFLQEIYSGQFVNLYRYADKEKLRFFIQEKLSSPQELKYHEYYNTDASTISSSPYKATLSSLALKYSPENRRLFQRINSMSYTPHELLRVANDLNQGRANAPKNRETTYFFGAGLSQNLSKFVGDNKDKFKSSTDYSFRLNFGMDTYVNPKTRKLIFRAELGASHISPTFQTYSTSHYTFKQFTATLTPQIIYNLYNTENLKAYLGLGWAFNASFYPENKLVNNASNTSIENFYKLESLWFSTPFRTGVFINNMTELSLSFVRFGSYTRHSNFGIGTQTLELGVHRFLGKKN